MYFMYMYIYIIYIIYIYIYTYIYIYIHKKVIPRRPLDDVRLHFFTLQSMSVRLSFQFVVKMVILL